MAGFLMPKRFALRLNRKSRGIPVPPAAAISDSVQFSWVCHSRFYFFLKTCYRIFIKNNNSAVIEKSQTRASLVHEEARGLNS